MTVELVKKKGTYKDKEGKDKPYVNFYVKCGDQMIPVEPKYFPNEKCEGRDPGFAGRKAVLDAFATELPDKAENGNFQ